VRDLVDASREWAATHPGLTLLAIEETDGAVVTTRNAQAWLVMPPVQPRPLLYRVLPTLPKEFESRHSQLAAGLARRLDIVRPSRLDGQELARLLEPDDPRWPDHYACWSTRAWRIVELAAPGHDDRAQWAEVLREGLRRCTAGPSRAS
jgi:hypothetical protein